MSVRRVADTFERSVQSAEIPYQANRRATKTIDIFRDDRKGMDEVLTLLRGIKQFARDLEELKNAAYSLTK